MSKRSQVPIAIIGMGVKLPGAESLAEFWQLLIEARTAVVELPPERLDRSLYYDPKVGVLGKSYSKLGAIVRTTQFDRQACPIDPELERRVDNAHLLMCQVAADALRHGGIDPFNVPLRNTGVFIGHAQGSDLGGKQTYNSYAREAAEILREVDEFKALSAAEQTAIIDQLIARIRKPLPTRQPDSPDVACSLVAGTISKAFGLNGPYLALNSACASSLQAMLVGARALQAGHIDMAIVGGASDCKGDSLVLFAHARAMSSTGSRPFDADADGLIVGEGYAAVVMKTLERALADGDRVRAVVRGLGVSSDGKGKSLWAPRKEGQVLAMQRAYRDGLDLGDLDYLEAHATATQLGDATELNTLSEVLRGKLPAGKKVAITSVKANIGHTLETAGIAGVIKTVLALEHNTIPPAANVQSLNPKIDWEQAPVYVPRVATPWNPHANGRPRRAGVNAFGIGGLNMHVIVEEFNATSRKLESAAPGTAAAAAESADDVAVIGMGCVLPGAGNVDAYWKLLVSRRDARTHVTPNRWRADLAEEPGTGRLVSDPMTLGGFITDFEYDWKTHKIPPKQVAQADPLQFMLLEAADQAIVDAGYHKRPFDRSRVGVVVGTEFGGDFAFELQMGLRLPELRQHISALLGALKLPASTIDAVCEKYSKRLLAHWPALVDETGSFSTSSLASRTAKTWDLMGGAVAVDSGQSSSLAALDVCVDGLLAGDCDMMICAAGQRRLGIPEYETLKITGVLAPEHGPGHPLDRGATGYIPGEGVGVLLLKRLSDAQRDGDPIRAIVRGVGAAHHPSSGEALRVAADRALASAGATASQVSLVEMDGSATIDRNRDDLRALESLGDPRNRERPLLVSSVVGQIGHTEAAAGMASLIKAGLELRHGMVPGAVGLDQPVDVDPQRVEVATNDISLAQPSGDTNLAAVYSRSRDLTYCALIEVGVPANSARSPGASLRTERTSAAAAVKSATTNVAVQQRMSSPVAAAISAHALSAASAPSSPTTDAKPGGWKIYRFSATDLPTLAQHCAAAAGNAERIHAQPQSPFSATSEWRAAIVANSPATLRARLEATAKQAANRATHGMLAQQGIVLAERGEVVPKLVCCFAGQGSQYEGMLQALVAQLPAAAAELARIDAILARYGYPSFAELAWSGSKALGSNVWLTQLSMLVANQIVYVALGEAGFAAAEMLGHSYGEYSALVAAGAIDFETALALTRARCDGIARANVEGGLVAVAADLNLVTNTATEARANVWLANHNAPTQTVVGGAHADLDRLLASLKAKGVSAQKLAVPAPFHTPPMVAAAAPLERALAAAEIQTPRVPLWSVANNSLVASADDVRRNLVAHLSSPVRYADLISKLAGEPLLLLEVGPSQVLTNLHRRILEGRGVALTASDQPKRPGLENIAIARAWGEVVGLFDADSSGNARNLPRAGSAAERHELLAFDATASRRQRMRQASRGEAKSVVTPAPRPAASAKPPTVAPAPAKPVAPAKAVAPIEAPKVAGSAPEPVAAASQPAAPAAAELERFLINFVVEQTGYPHELVELDADLEADLGIDSIKKAQLFGELQEYFDVVPTEDLTLDMFPTLRHVLDFLRTVPVKGDLGDAIAEPQATQAPESTAAPAPQPTRTVNQSKVEPEPAATQTGPAAAELEAFLINFVVEQTGYPHELVELDADLEADLGIDSIKKAQLFGELQEYFDVVPTEDLTLDMFPTLRHVLDFLRTVPVKGDLASYDAEVPFEPAVQTAAPISAESNTNEPPVQTESAGGPSADELEAFLINFVVEQTGYPHELVELDADLEADLGIDSIKKAQLFGELQEYFDVVPTEDLTLDMFPTLRHVLDFLRSVPIKGELPATADEAAPTASSDEADANVDDPAGEQDEQAERSGVEDDADFDVSVPNYSEVLEHERPLASATNIEAIQATPRAEQACIVLEGTPYEMGLTHGKALRDSIRRALRTYADVAGYTLEELPGMPADGRQLQELFADEELDELLGIADGAEVSLASVLVHNLVAYATLGEASLQLVASAPGNGHWHVGLWTLPLERALHSTLHPVAFERRPLLGNSHVVVAPAGAIGALAGIGSGGLTASGARTAGHDNVSTARLAWAATIGRLLAASASAAEAAPLLEGDRNTVCLALGEIGVDRHRQLRVAGGQVETTEHLTTLLVIESIESDSDSTGVAHARHALESLAAKIQGGNCPTFADLCTKLTAAESIESLGSELDDSVIRTSPALLSVAIDALGRSIRIAGPDTSFDVPLPELATRSHSARLAANGSTNGQSASAPTSAGANGSTASAVHNSNRHPKVVTAAAPIARASIVADRPPLIATDNFMSSRFVMHTVAEPFASDVADAPVWQGAALVVGNNPSARAMADRLGALGIKVHYLPRINSAEDASQAVDRAVASGPVPHLFLMSARDAGGDLQQQAVFGQRLSDEVRGPYFLAQRWVHHALEGKWIDRSTVVAATSMGGDFGFGQGASDPLGGGLSGLIKAMCLELHVVRGFKGLRVKLIDAPRDEPPTELAVNIVRELAWARVDYEVAFVAGQRRLQGSFAQPLQAASGQQYAPRGTWIVTGGARGITAECAPELGRRFGLRLHVLGTSPAPRADAEWRGLDDAALKQLRTQTMIDAQRAGRLPAEAWQAVSKEIEIDQALRAFEAAGVAASYHVCDVTDASALERVLAKVRAADGPIEGVLHGAGIERACRYERKTPEGYDATVDTKVLGAHHLMRLTSGDPIRHFVTYGSVSGRLGSTGQTDYCLASDLLAKLTGWYAAARRDCHAVCFHWHPWDEVGMAYRPETRATFQMTDAPPRMPKREGLAHLVRELTGTSRAAEVLITNDEYFERFYGPGSATPKQQPSESFGATGAATNEANAPLATAPTTAATDTAQDLKPVRIAQRHTLELVAAPLGRRPPQLKLSGNTVVLGNNPDAASLRQQLADCGANVLPTPNADDPHALLAALEAAWKTQPVHHLFLLTARDPQAAVLDSPQAIAARREWGIEFPLLATRLWLRQLPADANDGPAHLVAVTSLGGDFGAQSIVPAPEGGAPAAMLKSLHIESARRGARTFAVKVLDFDASESSDRVAQTILTELAANQPEIEVAYGRATRRIVKLQAAPSRALPEARIARDETWVVTGGARGITAAAAAALGERYGIKLHLLGRSPAPQADAPWRHADDQQLRQIKKQIVRDSVAAGRSPEDAWLRVSNDREIAATLASLAARGVRATYHSCDVSDWQALSDVLAQVRKADGPIHGVIHGAGYGKPGRLEMKDPRTIERTVRPKWDGTLALAALTATDPVRHFITFGSISGRFGGNGLSDYSAANDAMAKCCSWLRGQRPTMATTCIEWQTWDEVGMAARGETAAINRKAYQMDFIPAAEGIAHLVDELRLGLPASEVVITDGFFERHFAGGAKNEPADESTSARASEPAPRGPLLDSMAEGDTPSSSVSTITFDPTADPFLLEHHLRDAPFLPGVVAIEAMTQAALAAAPGKQLAAIRQVRISQGIKFLDSRKVTAHARTLLARQTSEESDLDVALTVEVRNRRGALMNAARAVATAKIELAIAPAPLVLDWPGASSASWHDYTYPPQALVTHGPRLQALKQIAIDAAGMWGIAVAPPASELAGTRSAEGWQLPLALVDACLVGCATYLFLQCGGRIEIPQEFGELRLGTIPPAGERCTLRLDYRDSDARGSRFDFSMFDAHYQPVFQVRDYRTMMVGPAAQTSEARPVASASKR